MNRAGKTRSAEAVGKIGGSGSTADSLVESSQANAASETLVDACLGPNQVRHPKLRNGDIS
jgi:hypothetical protein